MFNWVRSRIGLRIAFLISIMLLVTGLLFIYVSADQVSKFGELAVSLNSYHIRKQAESFLLRNTRDRADKYSTVFQNAEAASHILAKQAETLINHIPIYQSGIGNKRPIIFHRKKDRYANSKEERISLVHAEKGPVSDKIKNKIAALSHLDNLMINAKETCQASIAAWLITEDRITKYYPNLPLIDVLPPLDEFDARTEPFYTIAKPANNPLGKSMWTEIYQDPAGQGLVC